MCERERERVCVCVCVRVSGFQGKDHLMTAGIEDGTISPHSLWHDHPSSCLSLHRFSVLEWRRNRAQQQAEEDAAAAAAGERHREWMEAQRVIQQVWRDVKIL